MIQPLEREIASAESGQEKILRVSLYVKKTAVNDTEGSHTMVDTIGTWKWTLHLVLCFSLLADFANAKPQTAHAYVRG